MNMNWPGMEFKNKSSKMTKVWDTWGYSKPAPEYLQSFDLFLFPLSYYYLPIVLSNQVLRDEEKLPDIFPLYFTS